MGLGFPEPGPRFGPAWCPRTGRPARVGQLSRTWTGRNLAGRDQVGGH